MYEGMAASILNINSFFSLPYFKKGDNNAGLQGGTYSLRRGLWRE